MSEPRFIPAAEYHAIKALSAGMIWTMDSECPAKAFIDSPWNPARKASNTRHFDIGIALHLAILEPAELDTRTTIVRGLTKKGEPSPGYVSIDAKEQRDAAYDAGITPLLPEEMEAVQGMRRAIHEHRTTAKLLTGGMAETTLTWEWQGLLCKCRPDWLANDCSYVVDLKSAITANPRAVSRKGFAEGWFVRAVWYLNGIQAATGVLPERYIFIVTEKDAPHLIEPYQYDAWALLRGEKIIERGITRAAECLRVNKWPGYGTGEVMTLSLPNYAEFQLAEDEAQGE